MADTTIIYIDGSYSEHTSVAGIGIFFSPKDKRNCSITIHKTEFAILNNGIAESLAMYCALFVSQNISDITIFSDSQHVVSSLTDSHDRFIKSNWTTTKNKPVAQSDILKQCSMHLVKRFENGLKTFITWVPGHSGIYGNEQADFLATQGRLESVVGLPDTTNIAKIVYTSNKSNIVASYTSLLNLQYKMEQVYTADAQEAMTNNAYSSGGIEQGSKADNSLLVNKIPTEQNENVRTTENIPAKIEYNVSDITSSKDIKIQLFYSCLQCLDTILVSYPSTISKKTMRNLVSHGHCLISYTICKDCIAKNTQITIYTEVVKLGEQYIRAMDQLNISSSILEAAANYQSIRDISGLEPVIVTNSGQVKFTPVDAIVRMCDKSCTICTVDVGSNTILPYLKVGFLL